MNPIAILFVAVASLALLAIPRRWAFVPLLAGACYMTLGQAIELGPLTFSVVRILVAVGGVRVLLRGERLAGTLNALDGCIIIWSLVACVTSVFHEDAQGELITRLGTSYDACGIYFLLRVWCSSLDDVVRLCRAVAIVLAPVAAAMLYEHLASHNLFSVFGGVPVTPMVREGRIRAFGPFTHPILTGTVGAVTFPLVFGIRRHHPRTAYLGGGVCLFIVVASSSSGPLLSLAAGMGALWAWRFRQYAQLFRRACVAGYLALEVIMRDPAYYIIARMDVIGGSTGWHRAALIEASIKHLNEWWLGGTDYTRHWLPTGVSWSAKHTDITSHYLHFAVIGGLPLMLMFIAILVKGFSAVGIRLKDERHTPEDMRPMIWGLGAALFAQAVTCVSVSYFDQSVTFLYLTLAAIGSASKAIVPAEAPATAAAVVAPAAAVATPRGKRAIVRTPAPVRLYGSRLKVR
jgi:hypothetical protein